MTNALKIIENKISTLEKYRDRDTWDRYNRQYCRTALDSKIETVLEMLYEIRKELEAEIGNTKKTKSDLWGLIWDGPQPLAARGVTEEE